MRDVTTCRNFVGTRAGYASGLGRASAEQPSVGKTAGDDRLLCAGGHSPSGIDGRSRRRFGPRGGLRGGARRLHPRIAPQARFSCCGPRTTRVNDANTARTLRP
jgi:hypothetical protein